MMRQKGYTLIELLTTLGVATVLISVAMPNMQSFRMNSRQTGKINELIATMHLARNTAVTTNTRVTLCASSNGNTCESVAWTKAGLHSSIGTAIRMSMMMKPSCGSEPLSTVSLFHRDSTQIFSCIGRTDA